MSQGSEDEVFTGYSCDSGRAIRPSDVLTARSELSPLSPRRIKFPKNETSDFPFDSSLEDKITEKLNLSLDLINRSNRLQDSIRQDQKKEMV
jgi:hypothetical protein